MHSKADKHSNDTIKLLGMFLNHQILKINPSNNPPRIIR